MRSLKPHIISFFHYYYWGQAFHVRECAASMCIFDTLYSVPKYVVPKYGVPKYSVPNAPYIASLNEASQYGVPKYGVPKYSVPKCGVLFMASLNIASLFALRAPRSAPAPTSPRDRAVAASMVKITMEGLDLRKIQVAKYGVPI